MIASNSTHQSRGFTLVEVMVAVVVIAVSVSAVLTQMISAADNTAYLRDKTIAQWVALNQLELAYLENAHTNKLPERESSGSEKMWGREWFWQIKPVKAGDAKEFLQLQVSVGLSEEPGDSLVSISGLVDTFHEP